MKDFPALQDDQQTYLLLERSSVVYLLQALYQREDVPQWLPLFADTSWAPYMEESPLLIQADGGSPFFLWAIDGMAGSGSIRGLILESPNRLDDVAEWTRRRLTVCFDDGRTGLLRFYDPLVWVALDPEDMGDRCVVSRVHYWPGQGEGNRWQLSNNPEFVIAGDPVRLDKARAEAITGAPV